METLAQHYKEYLNHRVSIMQKVNKKYDWKYVNFEELVLNCGQVMAVQLLPDYVKIGLQKSCYQNSFKLAQKHKHLTYVEGFAVPQNIPIPIFHAWLMTPDGYAIDPTWKTLGDFYLGIPLSLKWVNSVLEQRREQGEDNNISIFEGNYIEDYSLLKFGFPPDALYTVS